MADRAVRNILYAGTILAGVSTTVRAIAASKGVELGIQLPPQLELTTRGGGRIRIRTDVRTSYYFENARAGLARCASKKADAHMKWLHPRFVAHLEYLEILDGIVFVVDSQPERVEANLGFLDRLTADLADAGRSPPDIPLVFQCNKQDLPRALPVSELAPDLRWPRCEHVPSIAMRGEGVIEALRVLLDLSPSGPRGAPPYR